MGRTAQGDCARREAGRGSSGPSHSRWDRPVCRHTICRALGRAGCEPRLNVRDASEIEHSITNFARLPNGGLIVTASALTVLHRDLIIGLAGQHKLPAIYYRRNFVTSGGLISYGYDLMD